MADKKEVIIFAEDDLSTTKVLLYLLTRDGYQVYSYSSGVGVLEGVKEHRPALILLDIMMPVKDGLTVLKEIREVPEIAETPVIRLTALKDENSVNKSIEYGVADFIIKPFKLNDLSLRVKKLIDISQNKDNQAQLRQSPPEHFRVMLDSTPFLMWELGVDRQCTFLNKSCLDFTGKSMEQGLGNGWNESIYKDDINRVLEAYNSSFESRKAVKFKFRLRHYSGDFRWVLGNCSPQFSSEEIFIGYLISCFDFSEQNKMQTDLKMFSKAIMQCPVSVIITNYNGVIEFVNPFYTELTGFTLNESVGKVEGIFKRGEISDEESKQLWKTILAGMPWKGEIYSIKKNGEKFLESVSISPIKNDESKIINYIVIKKNINTTQIIKALTSAKEKAEELNRNNSEFLSGLNYELKTSLFGIFGFSDILKTELHDTVYSTIIEGIIKSGKKLDDTLNSFGNASETEIIVSRRDFPSKS
jgi:PAS domain S-box-containing protein